MSAIPPDQYATRFVKFIRENVRPKDSFSRTKEDLSHVVIPEESPPITPSPMVEKTTIDIKKEEERVVGTVTSSPKGLSQKEPVIYIQQQNSEIKVGELPGVLHSATTKTEIKG